MYNKSMSNTERTAKCLTSHEKCVKCGHRLFCAVSRARGYGWTCWRIVRAAGRKLAELAAFTARQIEQARELVEDCAIIPAGVRDLFFSVSTDGSEFYRTTLEFCDCPAHASCYHQAALVMVTA
jgi:hypothetical protein